jgi:hypothetical protein
MTFAVKSVTRDDERPVHENMSTQKEVIGGFVVRFTEPLSASGLMHVRVDCPVCGQLGFEDRSSLLGRFVSGTAGGGACISCGKCMLSLSSRTVDNEPDVIVFSVNLAGAVPGVSLRKDMVRFEVVSIQIEDRDEVTQYCDVIEKKIATGKGQHFELLVNRLVNLPGGREALFKTDESGENLLSKAKRLGRSEMADVLSSALRTYKAGAE